jgi:hypothetical protein
MKVSTIDISKNDILSSGKLTEEARTKLRDHLMSELKDVPEKVKEAVMSKLGGALGGLMETGDLAALSAQFILEGLERTDAILDGLPAGVKLLAKTGARGSGRVTFELGMASSAISMAQASLEIAIRDIKHYLECSCSPLNEDKEDAAEDAAKAAAPTQEPQPS